MREREITATLACLPWMQIMGDNSAKVKLVKELIACLPWMDGYQWRLLARIQVTAIWSHKSILQQNPEIGKQNSNYAMCNALLTAINQHCSNNSYFLK